ncbi:DNA polymerase III subunit beta [Candidatus Wolfebacteria bacterium]|nr:DNA polymerase III subunit beta [Candidatus Wolfebacteria bacterium]
MKIIILKNHLKAGFEIISRIGSENNSATLPILKNFLIETIDNKIKLSMTNLEIAITCYIPGKIIEGGSLVIPFNILNSIINNLQNERINLDSKNNYLIIKTDNYQAKIQGEKKEEFPIIPKIESQNFLEFSALIFKKALSLVVNASQISEIKPELGGILFDFQVNCLKLAATDSFRLAEKNIINTQFKSNIKKGFKTIIPLKTIQEVIRILKEENNKITVYFEPNQVLFKTENSEIISRVISGNFPEYQSIIPESFETEVSLNKEELINALKLTSSFTDKLNEIKILIKEKAKNIEVFSFNQILGENQYLIPAKIKGSSVEIVFNWRFLLDGIKVLDSEEIFMGFNNENKPILIKSPKDISCFYILMPIKSN